MGNKCTNAFLFVTHKVNEEILERYYKLEKETKSIGQTFFLLNNDDDDYNVKNNLFNKNTLYIFNNNTFDKLDYEPIAETIVPGSNHFATLQFFKDNPRFTFYWVIEYDVIFTGKWSVLFENFKKIDADFISSNIERFADEPSWFWWKSLHLDGVDLKTHQLLKSFNPIYRISNKALMFLDDLLKGRKNWGHHEVLIPTALAYAKLKLLDFGGNGEFVLPQFKERFYINRPLENIRTMRFRPFVEKSELILPDKLFHPVKTPDEKESIFVNSCMISVIMPVYNCEKYVSESILSILNQTFCDFEFIIIDDCSTDNTWKIIQSFSDNRIIAIKNKKNLGNYPSRNIGMKKARGKYIAVMDGDDIALPDRFIKQYCYLEKNPEILAIGTQSNFIGFDYIRYSPVSYEKICAGLLINNCFLHPSLLIRKEVIKQLNGYNEKYIYSSDYDLVCRMSLLGKIENLAETCMLYRLHPEQISQKKVLEQMEFAFDIRQKHQIAFINKYKPSELPEVGDSETGHLHIGQVIGLYIMGDCFDKMFRKEADILLEYILDHLDLSMPLCIKRGLLGVGIGLIYLLRNNFVEGDEDEVLESIDIAVFDLIKNIDEKMNVDWCSALCYLNKRVELQNTENPLAQLKIKQAIRALLDAVMKI